MKMTLEQRRKIWAQATSAPLVIRSLNDRAIVSENTARGSIDSAKFYRDFRLDRVDEYNAQRFVDSTHLETLVATLRGESASTCGHPDLATFLEWVASCHEFECKRDASVSSLAGPLRDHAVKIREALNALEDKDA